MTHDIVIRGGAIVDGTGAGPHDADLAINGGRISAIGKVAGQGRQEIDAAGHVVSPGFVDLHTHLDAQIGSLGDAGAHVSQIMDADWSTFVLSYWIRDRALYSLGEGVRRITSGPARVMGLSYRGVLQEGKRADVNVFDLAAVRQLQPEIVHDFPGGAPRYVQRARGYRATIVNGQINVLGGVHTGARAGMVLRHGAGAAAAATI